jgi:SAM-dependent methyltransferase
MPLQLFDQLPDVYDALIDWPKRLANEGPFYRRWFDRLGIHSAVDVACGTGHHAAMLHGWGLRIEGSDLSPKMIEQARAAHGEPDGLRWTVRGFDQAIEPPGSFDAAICVGNSLALAPDVEMVRRVIGEMLAAIRGGGLVVVHVLNLWRLPEGPCTWQKCRRATLPPHDVLILKGVHRADRHGFVDLVVANLADNAILHAESVPFLGLEADELEDFARQAGARQLDFFGGYRDQPYDRSRSVDLLMVARRG